MLLLKPLATSPTGTATGLFTIHNASIKTARMSWDMPSRTSFTIHNASIKTF